MPHFRHLTEGECKMFGYGNLLLLWNTSAFGRSLAKSKHLLFWSCHGLSPLAFFLHESDNAQWPTTEDQIEVAGRHKDFTVVKFHIRHFLNNSVFTIELCKRQQNICSVTLYCFIIYRANSLTALVRGNQLGKGRIFSIDQ